MVCLLSATTTAAAQTAATYSDRARLALDEEFRGRVAVAAMVGAVAVILEEPTTAEHETRLRLAGYALREPEVVARRLTAVLAATVPASTSDGVVSASLTDAQLQGIIAQRWTVIAAALTTP